MAGRSRPAEHRTILVVDVAAFGDHRRTRQDQLAVREGLYRALRQALDAAGISWADCHHEDRGDAVFVLAPANVFKALFVELLPDALARALCEHNAAHPIRQQIRLRMALHAGEVAFDDHGVTATAINLTFRLLDAHPLKTALAESPGVLAAITSSWFFDEVVRHSAVIDAATYRQVRVEVKETATIGWISLPDHPYPSDPTVLTAASPMTTATPTAKVPATASVDEHLQLLATASRNQWMAAANDRRLLHPVPLPVRWRRTTEPVAGPVSAAAYPRFDPLPGLGEAEDTLHQVYGRVPSGRLLVIGPPGSGKTAAGILLLLDALRHRERAKPEDQARIPVPVLFTLHGWDPDSGESVIEWLVGKLADTYPMFSGRGGRQTATDLLTAGRITGLLDGLDEIPESVRPGVLEALADAPFRVVLLSRTTEAVAAAHHSPLLGAIAVELRPVTPTDAASYLLEPLIHPPPSPWQRIGAHLAEAADGGRRTSALSEALSTPLALSLLRDVYGRSDPVDELLDAARFPTAADIENHLLDHAVIAAYTPRPGHPAPRYTVTIAQRTLRYVATRLTQHRTTDLAWWHIPTWTSHRSRMIMSVITTLLMNQLVYGLVLGLVFGPFLGFTAGLVFAIIGVFALMASPWRGVAITPRRITRLSYRSTWQGLMYGLAAAVTAGLLAGLAVGLAVGLSVGLLTGLVVGLASGLAGLALSGMARRTEVDDSSLGPADVWRQDRIALRMYTLVFGLAVGFMAVLTAILVPGLASGLASRPLLVLSAGLSVALVVGLGAAVAAKRMGNATASPGAAAVQTTLAAAHLAVQHKLPLRLIEFLEDARSRHLLRTVGPVYQFRHAKLQDRLAQPTQERLSPIAGAM